MSKHAIYKSNASNAYVTAINILAVEYLIKTNDQAEYIRRVNQVYDLTEMELEDLYFWLTFNMHTSTLGAMITQGDYAAQRELLFDFLDAKEKKKKGDENGSK